MAWRFRKSARLPLGFRLNASKSGLGFSWGFRGFRIGRDAKGRTVRTLSIPGTGVFNRQVISTACSRATFVTVNSRGVGYQRRTENLEPGPQPESDSQLPLDSIFHVPVAARLMFASSATTIKYLRCRNSSRSDISSRSARGIEKLGDL